MSDNSTLIDAAKAAASIFSDARTDGMPSPYAVSLYPTNAALALHFAHIHDLERWATWRGVTETHTADTLPDALPTYAVDVLINGSRHKHATLRCVMHGVRVIAMASGRADAAEEAAAIAGRAVVSA